MKSILFFCALSCNQEALSVPSDCFEEPDRQAVFQHAKKRIQGSIEHMKDFVDFWRQHGGQDQIIPLMKKNMFRIKASLKLIQLTERGDVRLETAMKRLLWTRLDNLRLRKENIEKVKADTEGRYLHGKTNPNYRETLSQAEKIGADLATDLYQTRNELILGLYALIKLKKLPYNIQFLIAASPALWPRLQGFNTDPGHPDEAIVDDNETFFEGSDVELYERYLYPSQKITLPVYASFHKTYGVFTVSPFEAQEIQGRRPGERTIPPLDIPAFLKQKPTAPLLQAPSVAKLLVEEKLTPKKAIQSQKPKKKKQQAALRQMALEDQTDVAQHLFQESKLETEIPPQKESIQEQKIPATKEKIAPALPQADKEYEPFVPLEILSKIKQQAAQTMETEEEAEAGAGSVSLSEADSESKFETHPQTPPKLKTAHPQTYAAIFDHTRVQNVRFQDFQTLWTSLGGEIVSHRSGGSHRVLKWQGKTLGGTFVPHGGGAYGPRSIRSLREALDDLFQQRHLL
jgi:hypothetical protein